MMLRHAMTCVFVAAMSTQPIKSEKLTLFDFTTMNSVNNWMEVSDTVRKVGKSKATLVLQKAQEFQNAVFFTLLNPQPNGAGFAGVRAPLEVNNLSSYKNITMKCKAQGKNTHYKIVLRHKKQTANNDITYENFFTVPLSDEEFTEVKLELSNFKPYFRGAIAKDAEPLDTENITSLGLQIFGGVYSDFKQSGVSALTIENICATV